MKANGRILVIGSSNTDMTVKSRTMPRPGDTFCGALGAALSRGDTLSEAAAFATRASALAVTRMGAQDSIPYLSDLN